MTKNNSEQNSKLLNGLNSALEEKEGQLDLIENLIEEYQIKTQFGSLIVRKFKAYSNNDYETFKIYLEKMYYSFQQVQRESEVPLSLVNEFEFHQILERTFMNVVRKTKAGQVNNFSSYLYIAFLNAFRSIAREIQRKKNNEVDLLYNFIENEK